MCSTCVVVPHIPYPYVQLLITSCWQAVFLATTLWFSGCCCDQIICDEVTLYDPITTFRSTSYAQHPTTKMSKYVKSEIYRRRTIQYTTRTQPFIPPLGFPTSFPEHPNYTSEPPYHDGHVTHTVVRGDLRVNCIFVALRFRARYTRNNS